MFDQIDTNLQRGISCGKRIISRQAIEKWFDIFENVFVKVSLMIVVQEDRSRQ